MIHSTTRAGWTEKSERGSPLLIRFMAWVSFTLGRGPSRVLLRAIIAYFVAFGGAARHAARDFLARALGRPPTLADLYRLYFHFGASLHDRIFFLRGRFDLFQVEMHGTEHFGPDGLLLMGGHLGSFEALRACGRTIGKRRVVMAMYEENARKINTVLRAIAPQAQQDIVALGHVQSMIELSERLDAGAVVGVLADRTLGDEPTLRIDFLGRPAAFPTGPMRMAAALRRPVFFMAGLYLGGNRYDMHFEPLADFSDLEGASRDERDARVQAAVRAYAKCLECYARRAPYDWFNFHDFWGARP
jgi:predicted LPLAT superfamily acyltransferase